ncbi:MAG TPA: type II toxin-antitoxin system RelE/ParE family toxin [Rhodocyclaceae bacterium]|nr:type II toxin-antitoxin system RelE/ParE family toxin [Rhodocyclaceae bacterium]
MAGKKSPKITVRLTANFERSLDEIEAFLARAEAHQVFNALLDALTDTVIPNLERFPAMGRPFLSHPIRSVEASNGIDVLRKKLAKLSEGTGTNAEIREYVLEHYLVLYVFVGTTIHLLSIRHHKQLSFDFQHLWSAS